MESYYDWYAKKKKYCVNIILITVTKSEIKYTNIIIKGLFKVLNMLHIIFTKQEKNINMISQWKGLVKYWQTYRNYEKNWKKYDCKYSNIIKENSWLNHLNVFYILYP